MRQPSYLDSLAVFVLFFGISVLDAFASRVWWRVAFWLLIGTAFAVLARKGRGRDDSSA